MQLPGAGVRRTTLCPAWPPLLTVKLEVVPTQLETPKCGGVSYTTLKVIWVPKYRTGPHAPDAAAPPDPG